MEAANPTSVQTSDTANEQGNSGNRYFKARYVVNCYAQPFNNSLRFYPKQQQHQMRNCMLDVSDIDGAAPKPAIYSYNLRKIPEIRNANMDVRDINQVIRRDCAQPTFKKYSERDFNFNDPEDINEKHCVLHAERDPQNPIYDWKYAEYFGPVKSTKRVKDGRLCDQSLCTNNIIGKDQATYRMRRYRYGERQEYYDFNNVDDINGDAYRSPGYYPTRTKCGGARSQLLRAQYEQQAHVGAMISDHTTDVVANMRRIGLIQQANEAKPANTQDVYHTYIMTQATYSRVLSDPGVYVCHYSIGLLPGPARSVYTDRVSPYIYAIPNYTLH